MRENCLCREEKDVQEKEISTTKDTTSLKRSTRSRPWGKNEKRSMMNILRSVTRKGGDE